MTPTAIKKARQALGLSVVGFARHLGTTPRTIRRWQDGSRGLPLPVEILIRIYLKYPGVLLDDSVREITQLFGSGPAKSDKRKNAKL